jgi:hypothetical protein
MTTHPLMPRTATARRQAQPPPCVRLRRGAAPNSPPHGVSGPSLPVAPPAPHHSHHQPPSRGQYRRGANPNSPPHGISGPSLPAAPPAPHHSHDRPPSRGQYRRGANPNSPPHGISGPSLPVAPPAPHHSHDQPPSRGQYRRGADPHSPRHRVSGKRRGVGEATVGQGRWRTRQRASEPPRPAAKPPTDHGHHQPPSRGQYRRGADPNSPQHRASGKRRGVGEAAVRKGRWRTTGRMGHMGQGAAA